MGGTTSGFACSLSRGRLAELYIYHGYGSVVLCTYSRITYILEWERFLVRCLCGMPPNGAKESLDGCGLASISDGQFLEQ
jgi:hypothetical protein